MEKIYEFIIDLLKFFSNEFQAMAAAHKQWPLPKSSQNLNHYSRELEAKELRVQKGKCKRKKELEKMFFKIKLAGQVFRWNHYKRIYDCSEIAAENLRQWREDGGFFGNYVLTTSDHPYYDMMVGNFKMPYPSVFVYIGKKVKDGYIIGGFITEDDNKFIVDGFNSKDEEYGMPYHENGLTRHFHIEFKKKNEFTYDEIKNMGKIPTDDLNVQSLIEIMNAAYIVAYQVCYNSGSAIGLKRKKSEAKYEEEEKVYKSPHGLIFSSKINLSEYQKQHSKGTGEGHHASPVQHMRAGHWHTYWKGKGKNKYPEVKWVEPTVVGKFIPKDSDAVFVQKTKRGA